MRNLMIRGKGGYYMFSMTFLALQHEGFLTHSCISSGLTEIRNANIGDSKGRFYTGFFQLTIGMERIAKLVLIVDHMLENNKLSSIGKPMKEFGHDLERLYGAVKQIVDRRILDVSWGFNPQQKRILSFLAKFAKRTRYANIDIIVGNAANDPLSEWNDILQDIFNNEVSAIKKQRMVESAKKFEYALSEYWYVCANDLSKSNLNLNNWLSFPQIIEEASRRAIVHLVTLIYPLTEVLGQLADISRDQGMEDIPYMSEFYHFLRVDERTMLNKKKW